MTVTISELFCYLVCIVVVSEDRIVCSIKIFGFGVTITDVVAIVVVIVSKHIEFLESVVKTCADTALEWEVFLEEFLAPLHWETASDIDRCVEAFTLVFLKNDVDDTCCAFCIVTN